MNYIPRPALESFLAKIAKLEREAGISASSIKQSLGLTCDSPNKTRLCEGRVVEVGSFFDKISKSFHFHQPGIQNSGLIASQWL
jgi:hypothetical protein